MSKLKTKIVRIVEKHLDQFEPWDTDHRFPKTGRVWEERVSDEFWCPYNETYGKGVRPAPGSFADFCRLERDDNPVDYTLVDGSYFTTSDSTLDRMAGAVHSNYPKGYSHSDKTPTDTLMAWFSETNAHSDETARRMAELYDRVVKAGDVASETFADFRDPDHVWEFQVIGSADFFDLDDGTKEFMTEKWYREWYEHNLKRGLVDFPYSYPVRPTNHGVYGSEGLDRALAAFKLRRDHKMSFETWLSAPYEG